MPMARAFPRNSMSMQESFYQILDYSERLLGFEMIVQCSMIFREIFNRVLLLRNICWIANSIPFSFLNVQMSGTIETTIKKCQVVIIDWQTELQLHLVSRSKDFVPL